VSGGKKMYFYNRLKKHIAKTVFVSRVIAGCLVLSLGSTMWAAIYNNDLLLASGVSMVVLYLALLFFGKPNELQSYNMGIKTLRRTVFKKVFARNKTTLKNKIKNFEKRLRDGNNGRDQAKALLNEIREVCGDKYPEFTLEAAIRFVLNELDPLILKGAEIKEEVPKSLQQGEYKLSITYPFEGKLLKEEIYLV